MFENQSNCNLGQNLYNFVSHTRPKYNLLLIFLCTGFTTCSTAKCSTCLLYPHQIPLSKYNCLVFYYCDLLVASGILSNTKISVLEHSLRYFDHLFLFNLFWLIVSVIFRDEPSVIFLWHVLSVFLLEIPIKTLRLFY